MSVQPLFNKIAIVTGGSRGIGAAIAKELAKRGAKLVLTYNSSEAQAKGLMNDIESLGGEAIMIQARGTDRNAPTQVVEVAVKKWGHIDIIVNNAGYGENVSLQDLTHEHWDTTMEVNVRMPVFLLKAALPHLGASPRIVNISSVAARAGPPMMIAYASSKAALEGATRCFATELGQQYNLTANCVDPGPVATDLWLRDTSQAVHDGWERRQKDTPAANRIATTDDISQIVAFLADESSRWSTGSIVNANGGILFS
ncbi:uncharacterized protein A1O9_07265 [Exophiala aquamarina CBS 119918]|uniref:Ketoreductase domain-containing protein n=1 Tax=Exophiala aquamarina CBS 119918 TaxID=1182545 RepID=A0A072PNG4_9EURO|nr:uncharacterized protein A1O9_07265 [Exophiala aquamarina CBS 119918]KEF57075.1 hypothetical protein A1O9_07265 [Exophiala aquamarina CBS 119918]